MLKKLAAVEPSILSKLRYMRISGPSPMLSIQRDPPRMKCGWAHVFKALPGLCLDRLTVIGYYSPTATADLFTLEQLIKQGDGWQELCFISDNSAILVPTKEVRHHGHWHNALRLPRLDGALAKRDGRTASVRFYRSKHASDRGLMISKPVTREAIFTRGYRSLEDFYAPRTAALSQDKEMEKEVLVVARRGSGVHYAVEPPSSGSREVKLVKRRKRPNSRRKGVMEDTYEHVDDYEYIDTHVFVITGWGLAEN